MTSISPELKAKIEQEGFGKTGDIGGQPKTRYWTPDGREIHSASSLHEYIQRDKTGKVIASGMRDANLDKGWLLQKPETLKLYCSHCDKWHDTQTDIKNCEKSRMNMDAKYMRKAKEERIAHLTGKTSRFDRLEALEKEMSNIKTLLKQLVGAK